MRSSGSHVGERGFSDHGALLTGAHPYDVRGLAAIPWPGIQARQASPAFVPPESMVDQAALTHLYHPPLRQI